MKRFLVTLIMALLVISAAPVFAIDINGTVGGGAVIQKGQETRFAPFSAADVTVKEADGFRLVSRTQYTYIDTPDSTSPGTINVFTEWLTAFQQLLPNLYLGVGTGVSRELRDNAVDATRNGYKGELNYNYHNVAASIGLDFMSGTGTDPNTFFPYATFHINF